MSDDKDYVDDGDDYSEESFDESPKHNGDQAAPSSSTEDDRVVNLFEAAANCDEVTFKALLGAGVDCFQYDQEGRTVMHWASSSGSVPIMMTSLMVGCDANATSEKGLTPLHSACLEGCVQAVHFLLSIKADSSCQTDAGFTPLMCAAGNGFTHIVQIMLATGCEHSKVFEPIGVSPLHLAACAGHLDTVDALLKWDTDVTLLSKNGKTALDYAMDEGHDGCALLIDKYIKGEKGNAASAKRDVEMVAEEIVAQERNKWQDVINQMTQEHERKIEQLTVEIENLNLATSTRSRPAQGSISPRTELDVRIPVCARSPQLARMSQAGSDGLRSSNGSLTPRSAERDPESILGTMRSTGGAVSPLCRRKRAEPVSLSMSPFVQNTPHQKVSPINTGSKQDDVEYRKSTSPRGRLGPISMRDGPDMGGTSPRPGTPMTEDIKELPQLKRNDKPLPNIQRR